MLREEEPGLATKPGPSFKVNWNRFYAYREPRSLATSISGDAQLSL
jgi:hypothetical protein